MNVNRENNKKQQEREKWISSKEIRKDKLIQKNKIPKGDTNPCLNVNKKKIKYLQQKRWLKTR